VAVSDDQRLCHSERAGNCATSFSILRDAALAGVACGGEDITVAVPVSRIGEASVDLEEVEDAASEPVAAPAVPASTDIELLDDEPIEDPASCLLEVGGVAFFRAHRSDEFSVPPCIRTAVSTMSGRRMTPDRKVVATSRSCKYRTWESDV